MIRSQGWTPHEQDSGPYKRNPESSSTFFHDVKKLGEHQPLNHKADTESAVALTFNLPDSRILRNKCSLFISPSAYGILL